MNRRIEESVGRQLAVARQALGELEALALRARINDSSEARISAALYLSILEQFGATLLLIARGYSSHAPVMIRPMLEALADLRNILIDIGYADRIRLKDAKSNIRMFNDYAQIKGMSQDAIATLRAWMAEAQPVVAQLTAAGVTICSEFDKFQHAGMQNDYVSYRVLCSFSHNQLTTLIARHGGELEMLLHRDAPQQTTASMLGLALAVACQATEKLAAISSLPAQEVQDILDGIDRDWTSSVLTSMPASQ